MKILHTADWHLGAYVGQQCDNPMKRMENTLNCLDALIETAVDEQPDLILIAGDIFHTAKVWSDRANVEVRVAAQYISQLNVIAPTVVLYGTPNHDNFEQFCTLEKLTDAVFISQPEIKTVYTILGPIQVAGLPGFDKGFFRAQHPGLSAEEENRIFTEQLDSIVQGLSALVDPAIPSILMAHHTVVGCQLDNGQHVFQANEVVLNSATLENSVFDMVCLGHIHRAQIVGEVIRKPIFYSGSIDAFTFNDEETVKGFWIHQIRDLPLVPKYINSQWFDTPARGFQTCTWNEAAIKTYIDSGLDGFSNFYSIQNKVVRILYSCDKATEKALDKKKLERDLYAAGAYYVAEIRPEKITAEVNKEKLHEKLTIWDCLRRYLREKFKEKSFADILTEAEPIVSEIEASVLSGSQTGMFLPVEIEVRNYRSYADEKLNFEDLFFCMVNGKNGSGKSSLVMDAIVDCLYEEPREGGRDKTVWIQKNTKSGSINFTFILGSDKWRIIRTRQQSGNPTLNLAKYNSSNKEWENESCSLMDDTQKKIVNLLGMDANTFRSCVLIMQDQYGRFMESKSEDRMSVLTSLLGLGIYEQLEDKTKKLLTKVNGELKQSKDEVFVLEQDISTLEGLQLQKSNTELKLKNDQAAVTLLKKDQAATTEKVTLFSSNKSKLEEISAEISKKNTAISNAFEKLTGLTADILETKEFLKLELYYTEKVNELQQVRNKITAMDGTVKLVDDKKRALASLLGDSYQINETIKKYRSECDEIYARLEMSRGLEEELQGLIGIEEELKLQEEKKASLGELAQKILSVSGTLKSIDNSIQSDERQAAILKNSNCIDINRAQCGFLREAKEAEARLIDLQKNKIDTLQELNRLEGERSNLRYNSAVHDGIKAKVNRAQQIRNQLAILEGEKKSGEMYTKQIAELEMKSLQNAGQIIGFQDEIAKITPQISSLPELEAEAAELEPYESMHQDITKAKAYLEATEPQLEDIKQGIESLTAEMNELENKYSLLKLDIDDCQKYVVMLEAISAEITGYERNISGYNRILGSLDEKIRILVDKSIELQKKQDAIKLLADKSARLQILSEAFSQDGIPHQIVRDIVPDLEESANEILSQMTGGRMSLEFKTERTLKSNKDKEVPVLDVMITDIDNGELPYLSRSGGQKTRCSLSVIFALAILKASRMGLQLGMLFIDEPAGLDEEGIDGYCTALETIHNLYPEMRIVAISHDERMKARFAQHLFIEVTEVGSKVRKS